MRKLIFGGLDFFFLENIYICLKHPVPSLWRWGMGCLLLIQGLNNVLCLSIHWCVQYHIMLILQWHLTACHSFTLECHRWLKSFLKENKDLCILHSQYHGCWCPGDTMSHGINSHGIDLVHINYSNITPEVKPYADEMTSLDWISPQTSVNQKLLTVAIMVE